MREAAIWHAVDELKAREAGASRNARFKTFEDLLVVFQRTGNQAIIDRSWRFQAGQPLAQSELKSPVTSDS
jgi:hypothetical protein